MDQLVSSGSFSTTIPTFERLSMLFNFFTPHIVAQFPANIRMSEITVEQARTKLLELAANNEDPNVIESFVFIEELNAIYAKELKLLLKETRRPLPRFNAGQSLVCVQYTGPIPQEGTTTLPEWSKIAWYLVEFN